MKQSHVGPFSSNCIVWPVRIVVIIGNGDRNCLRCHKVRPQSRLEKKISNENIAFFFCRFHSCNIKILHNNLFFIFFCRRRNTKLVASYKFIIYSILCLCYCRCQTQNIQHPFYLLCMRSLMLWHFISFYFFFKRALSLSLGISRESDRPFLF